MTQTAALHDALMVLLHDKTIVQHLQANDPQALRQALAAVEQTQESDDGWSVEEEQMHERRIHACDR